MLSKRVIPASGSQKAAGGPVYIKYLGTNSILIGDGKTHWMVDPHFTRPCKRDLLKKLSPDCTVIEKALADAGIADLRTVVLSHTHYDHALDAAETCRLTGATLVGSQSANFLGMGANLPPSQMSLVQDGDCLSVGDFQVTFFASRHILLSCLFNMVSGMHREIEHPIPVPAYFWQYREGTVFTLFVQHPHKRFLISSSAGYFANKPPPLKVDISILSMGGMMLKSDAYLTGYLQQMAINMGAQRVYLSHWDDFTTPLSSSLQWMPGGRRTIKRFIHSAQGTGLAVEVLPYGQEIEA
jgi:L-ascorbate metabolism protein UlaG (beta-lactamase superfamily)